MFFSEEKNQKTFVDLRLRCRDAYANLQRYFAAFLS